MGISQSNPSTIEKKHEVFLNFRGIDTRAGFTNNLYEALRAMSIETFMDDHGIPKGDEIGPELLKAIRDSMISVVIFSKEYASSKWCLRELVEIMKCMKSGQTVIPVFYKVTVSDVGDLEGSFMNGFAKLKKRFDEKLEKEQLDSADVEERKKVFYDEMQQWRRALEDASHVNGYHSYENRYESEVISKIVKDICEKLMKAYKLSPCDFKGRLSGIEERLMQVKSLLCLDEADIRIIGIWGMGGLGKTTIADAIFQQISHYEYGKCFINVRKRLERCRGLVSVLKQEVISIVLNDQDIKIDDAVTIPLVIKERLYRKKVFIVLDDMKNFRELQKLAGGLDRLGLGSRIVITTRNRDVLRDCRVNDDYIYEVEALSYLHSRELFCKCAFQQDYPSDQGLNLLVDRMVNYASGNPLALEVLGSSLNGKSKQEWESALDKLQKSPNLEILDVLKISYDGLDDKDKDIFLDIACFFEGKDKDYVAKILDDCYYSLSVLVDKSLVTVSRDRIRMHDLLKEMGHEIVRKESRNKLGNRSRLWKQEDALRALKNNDVNEAVQGIFLNMSGLKDIYLNSLVFEKMKNLRLLKFYFSKLAEFKYISKVHISNDLNYISNELRSFQWYGCPLKVLPPTFDPEKLVELVLPSSNVEQLWEGTKKAPKLRRLLLYDSPHLTKIPDLSDIPLIEEIDLCDCKSLLNIHSSIRYLNNLRYLNLSGCENLRSFPSDIHFEALECLDLSDCINLNKFPQISGNIRTLYLCGTGVEEVPSSIQNLNELSWLDMSECTRLKCISTSICRVKSLCHLSLVGCSELESFPEILEIMECWKELYLNETAIKELPSSIEHLNRLQTLSLRGCKYLETLPSSLCNLSSLTCLYLSSGSKLEKLPENLGCLKNLISLRYLKCRGLTTLTSLSGLRSLRNLTINDCNLAEIPKDVCSLSSLQTLELCGNLFESLPKSIKQLSRLRSLILDDCNMLQSLTNFPSSLQLLRARNCKLLCQLFPDTTEFERCNKFLEVLLTNCLKLNHKAVLNFFEEWLLMIKRYEKPVLNFSIFMPGSEIPAWFSYQSSGSSVNIQILRDNWVTRKCMGFAICAVLGFEDDYNDDGHPYVYCGYYFETSDVCSKKYAGFFYLNGNKVNDVIHLKVSIHSDHIFLAHVCLGSLEFSRRLEKLPARDSDQVDVSFKFKAYTRLLYEEPRCKVKYCAVHPIYAEEESIGYVKIFGCTIPDIQETSRWSSGKSDNHDKEVEPQPKRSCTEANRCSQSAIQTLDLFH